MNLFSKNVVMDFSAFSHIIIIFRRCFFLFLFFVYASFSGKVLDCGRQNGMKWRVYFMEI